MLGITLSYHRHLSHRSFKLPKWLEYTFAYLGAQAGQGDPLDWVCTHRYHHQHCDTAKDPHTPTQGFWFSHITWLFDIALYYRKVGGSIVIWRRLAQQPPRFRVLRQARAEVVGSGYDMVRREIA
ncbi:palmitoyl-monogalactosyldiacylglycerol delta-7 desaturase, chloroplastic isoform X1 [Iris pallida]|uniref:Palmitoyl-monogalactosyldiacylglycerol delta-7 desaturase, chloroplastic isoform X1 n=1 Tax=Iris pallida TaxID=29817 RepID=A0AAX6GGX0_IRIPA|nr:palmitoyl-monogalactosyldiacylglycerol delta-7 desaturase, chloroplastic isoform X1 [Iris pallida]